jgi:hypothetical protein
MNSVSVYRMLAGKDYQPKSLTESIPFKSNPPAAVAPRNYNRPETNSQTRVAYGSGMSEWCMNCHSGYNSKNSHPTGNGVKFPSAIANAYNSFLPGDNPMRSYLTLTPFETGTSDYGLLKKIASTNDSQLAGPAGANVSCLSCHRAHASAWSRGLRFNDRAKYMTVDDGNGGAAYPDPAKDPANAQGRTVMETRKAYYDRDPGTFGARRGAPCSKCHAKE